MSRRASTRGTVLIAGAANISVGAIKLAAGLMVGSSAMLAEAAHSAADTLNQAFLLTSVHRGKRPADQRHPFGYGQERYFWSLLTQPCQPVTSAVTQPRRPVIRYVARAAGGDHCGRCRPPLRRPVARAATRRRSGLPDELPESGLTSQLG